jgi:hypothetical protein
LKVTDADGVERSTETRVPIADSEAKGEAFLLHFCIYKFSQARELTSSDNGATLLSRLELHLQGSFQIDWQEIPFLGGKDLLPGPLWS